LQASAQSAGRDAVYEEAERRGLTSFYAVFWHTQSHGTAFNADGALVEELVLHWEGDRKRIAAALTNAVDGFEVVLPSSDLSAFSLAPPVVAAHDVDPSEEVPTWRFLSVIAASGAPPGDEQMLALRRILRSGSVPCSVWAVQLMSTELAGTSAAVALRRAASTIRGE
jgi:hypothetical protein